MRRWSVGSGDAWRFWSELAWRRKMTVKSSPSFLSAGDIIYRWWRNWTDSYLDINNCHPGITDGSVRNMYTISA